MLWNVNDVINFLGAFFSKYVCYVGLCGELLRDVSTGENWYVTS